MAAIAALELFEALAPLLSPALEAGFKRRDLCILATRVALDVAEYFGVEARPVAVRAMLYNRAFAARLAHGDFAGDWKADGSYSVGIGFGFQGDTVPTLDPATRINRQIAKWNGHLIAAADGVFADFAIQQAEREQHGIMTGAALVGPWRGAATWKAENDEGTVVEYQLILNDEYLLSPDWKDRSRRTRVVGDLIRQIKREKFAG